MPPHEWQAIDVKRELVLRHLIHLRRWRNRAASPLYRLPTELVLEISALVVRLTRRGFRFWVTLTSVCHRLREMLICSSLPWGAVYADPFPLAKVFLERCRFDPQALSVMDRLFRVTRSTTDKTPFWEGLEGRTFNNLRFLMFRGLKNDFEQRITDLLRRTPNLSSLEIETSYRTTWDLEWTLPMDQLPHLTMLRVSQVLMNWTAPILRNLTKLILNFASMRSPGNFTSLRVFLSVLENCPDLEILRLTSGGPTRPGENEDDREMVRLYKLRELFLFVDTDPAALILSYVWFPESTKVQLETSCPSGPYLALSQILPPPDRPIFQYLRETTTVVIGFDQSSYHFTTNNFSLALCVECDEESHQFNLVTVPQFVSKVVEIIGGDAVRALYVESEPFDIPRAVWRTLLHGFPHLTSVSYSTAFDPSVDRVDPFCSVFYKPFRGGVVSPRLQDLRIPWSLAQGYSAATLKQALLGRDAYGRRLKRISLSTRVEGEMDILGPFRDVVDEVSRFRIPSLRPSYQPYCSWPMESCFFPDRFPQAWY